MNILYMTHLNTKLLKVFIYIIRKTILKFKNPKNPHIFPQKQTNKIHFPPYLFPPHFSWTPRSPSALSWCNPGRTCSTSSGTDRCPPRDAAGRSRTASSAPPWCAPCPRSSEISRSAGPERGGLSSSWARPFSPAPASPPPVSCSGRETGNFDRKMCQKWSRGSIGWNFSFRASKSRWQFQITLQKALDGIENNTGPKIEPWGTPFAVKTKIWIKLLRISMLN